MDGFVTLPRRAFNEDSHEGIVGPSLTGLPFRRRRVQSRVHRCELVNVIA